MELTKYFEESLKKYGDIDSQVWYRHYYDSNPLLRNKSGKIDYQSLLKSKICERVKSTRDSLKHKESQKKVSQDLFFPGNADRISAIERKKIPKKYKSVVNGTIINNIVQIANNDKKYEVDREKHPDLPYIIDGVWLVFGNDYDMYEFLKAVFYSLCEDLFIMYTHSNVNGSMEISADTEIIQSLLSFSAPFSLIHGFLKISIQENQNYITNSDVFNKRMRKILIDTIEYVWTLIAGNVLQLFKDTFEEIEKLNNNDPDYRSGNLNLDIQKWNKKFLIPFIKNTISEISKKDRIANIGLLVDNIMKELLSKREGDKNYNLDTPSNQFSKHVLDISDKILIQLAMQLTKSQYDDTVERNKLKYMQIPTAEEIEKLKDFELEGTYYELGTNKKISFE